MKTGSKSSKPKVQNLRQNIREHLFGSCRPLDYHKNTGSIHHLTKTAIFIATPIKNIFSSSFNQRILFCQFVDRKIVRLIPKYSLFAADTNQVSMFFLTSDKNEKVA